jgi:hypothetical protein
VLRRPRMTLSAMLAVVSIGGTSQGVGSCDRDRRLGRPTVGPPYAGTTHERPRIRLTDGLDSSLAGMFSAEAPQNPAAAPRPKVRR